VYHVFHFSTSSDRRITTMKLCIQRVLQAAVSVDDNVVASIKQGLLIFVGVTHQDSADTAKLLAQKCAFLRIFEDEMGKTNLSLADVGGEILVVSQFTLYADCMAGRRPSFTAAAGGEKAKSLYETFVASLQAAGISVQTGVFGAAMQISLINDGPFTVLLEASCPCPSS
jgi:D-tyrosyl-tRNA(Tyr) deacylase